MSRGEHEGGDVGGEEGDDAAEAHHHSNCGCADRGRVDRRADRVVGRDTAVGCQPDEHGEHHHQRSVLEAGAEQEERDRADEHDHRGDDARMESQENAANNSAPTTPPAATRAWAVMLMLSSPVEVATSLAVKLLAK